MEFNKKHGRVVLHIKGLKKAFGERKVLRGIDVSLKKGESLALLGQNGAGKTTNIRILLGIVIATEGSIRVFDLEYPKGLKRAKFKMGVVPQMDNLDPDLTVFENLIVYANYFRISKKVARKRAEELLEFFALKNRRSEIIQNLSGGQRRRLLLARALINRPELIILDEPTIGLDPQARLLIWERLSHLKEKGTTMLLTSHYMEEVERLADKVIIIDNGTAIAKGTPRGLVREMLGSEIVEFPDGARRLDEIKEYLGGCSIDMEVFENRLFVYLTDGCKELDSLISSFSHVTKRPATLEDLFLRLTGRKLRET